MLTAKQNSKTELPSLEVSLLTGKKKKTKAQSNARSFPQNVIYSIYRIYTEYLPISIYVGINERDPAWAQPLSKSTSTKLK